MRSKNLGLRPNCLLTEIPFSFISGPRSLIHYQFLAEDLQFFVQEHGYKTLHVPLSFRSTQARKHELQSWLDQNRRKPQHIIIAHQTWLELQQVLEPWLDSHPSWTITRLVSSNTVSLPECSVGNYDIVIPSSSWWTVPLTYRMHQLFCRVNQIKALPFEQTLSEPNREIYDRFLDRCIQLAENDYQKEFELNSL